MIARAAEAGARFTFLGRRLWEERDGVEAGPSVKSAAAYSAELDPPE